MSPILDDECEVSFLQALSAACPCKVEEADRRRIEREGLCVLAMAKKNYSRIEKQWIASMEKHKKEELLELAKKAEISEEKVQEYQQQQKILHFLKGMQHELKTIASHNKHLKEELFSERRRIRKFIEDPTTITKEDWLSIKKVKKRIRALREDPTISFGEEASPEAIEKHLSRAKYFRFNVKKGWIPL